MVSLRFHRARRLWPAALAVLLLAGCDTDGDGERKVGRNAYHDVTVGEKSTCGVVSVTTFSAQQGRTLPGDDAPVHTSTWINGDRYSGMEDNDLRGFLDGAFKEGWNQVSQTHLRLGRRARNPGFGEYELFRNLQRWVDLSLPAGASVVNAGIELSLESGPPFPVDVAVYAVRRDWNPGRGGVNEDNNSPPANGEVWWLAARHGSEPWSSAGVGHASDTDERADTYAQPLAIAHYEPGDSTLIFRSEQLARYVEQRIHADAPLLLLYKLTDPYEDSIGSVFEVWSANVGVAGSTRRPALTVDWSATPATTAIDVPVLLEPGRSIVRRDIGAAPGEIVAASYRADGAHGDGCGQVPHVEIRDPGGDWLPLGHPRPLTSDSFDLRITAATRPQPLGSTIELQIRDTWIPVGAPEDHTVHWSIRSPDTRVHEVDAGYAGDYTWRLAWPADIPGRWQFRWQHELSGSPVESEWHDVDVVAREPGPVRESLKRLGDAIDASGAEPRTHAMLPFEIAFMRLERAMAATLAGDAAQEPDFIRIISDLREKLSGRPVPAQFVPEAIETREASD